MIESLDMPKHHPPTMPKRQFQSSLYRGDKSLVDSSWSVQAVARLRQSHGETGRDGGHGGFPKANEEI